LLRVHSQKKVDLCQSAEYLSDGEISVPAYLLETKDMDVRTQSKNGHRVSSVADCQAKIAEELGRKHREWLHKLRHQPRQFRQLEEQIHQRFQEFADQVVASVLAEATASSPVLDREKKV
jgi:hypothetical protein